MEEKKKKYLYYHYYNFWGEILILYFNICVFFKFKYISGNRFKYIIKDVQRERCRDEEERAWCRFVKQQELNSNIR